MTRIPAVSRNRTIVYWVTTVILAGELGVGGVLDILQHPYVREIVERLGYPAYVTVILGVWKLPGAVVLLVPRFPRLKEWVYAGMVFNFTGAVASHLIVGDYSLGLVGAIQFIVLVAVSWALRPSDRRALAPS